jgi:hypothetical protein
MESSESPVWEAQNWRTEQREGAAVRPLDEAMLRSAP